MDSWALNNVRAPYIKSTLALFTVVDLFLLRIDPNSQ